MLYTILSLGRWAVRLWCKVLIIYCQHFGKTFWIKIYLRDKLEANSVFKDRALSVSKTETGTDSEMFSDDMNIFVSLKLPTDSQFRSSTVNICVCRQNCRILNSNAVKLECVYDCLYLLVLFNHHQMEFMWVPEY